MRQRLVWVGSKLILLHVAINDQNRDVLISNNIALAMGYEACFEKVELIATQIQAKPKYLPKGTLLHLKTMHIMKKGLSQQRTTGVT